MESILQCGGNCLGGKLDAIQGIVSGSAKVEVFFVTYEYKDEATVVLYEGGIFGEGLNCD